MGYEHLWTRKVTTGTISAAAIMRCSEQLEEALGSATRPSEELLAALDAAGFADIRLNNALAGVGDVMILYHPALVAGELLNVCGTSDRATRKRLRIRGARWYSDESYRYVRAVVVLCAREELNAPVADSVEATVAEWSPDAGTFLTNSFQSEDWPP